MLNLGKVELGNRDAEVDLEIFGLQTLQHNNVGKVEMLKLCGVHTTLALPMDCGFQSLSLHIGA
jgi:hypothetical protein